MTDDDDGHVRALPICACGCEEPITDRAELVFEVPVHWKREHLLAALERSDPVLRYAVELKRA